MLDKLNLVAELRDDQDLKEWDAAFLARLQSERRRQRTAIRGTGTAILRRSGGGLYVVAADNLIVNAGYDFISDAIGNGSTRPGVMNRIAVGTGTTAAAVAQTALITELNRQTATFSKPTTTQFRFEATFAAGVATGALTEAGVFNAASAGVMLDRVVFSVVNKGALDSLVQRFTFTMS